MDKKRDVQLHMFSASCMGYALDMGYTFGTDRQTGRERGGVRLGGRETNTTTHTNKLFIDLKKKRNIGAPSAATLALQTNGPLIGCFVARGLATAAKPALPIEFRPKKNVGIAT